MALSRRALIAGAAAATLATPPASASARLALRIGALLPLAGDAVPEGRSNLRAVAEAARMGLILGEEDAALQGAAAGRSPELLVSNAPTVGALLRAARRMVGREGVSVLVGGYSQEEARALSDYAEEAGILFLNVGAAADALRERCRPHTFHIEASAAMYLAALAAWFAGTGARRWALLHEAGAAGDALHATARAAVLRAGGGVALSRPLRPDEPADVAAALRAVAQAEPDAVLLLTDWLSQLDILARYEVAGLTAPITGFPEAATQTRGYLYAVRQAAPAAGSGHRAALWEATFAAGEAGALNARFASRWGNPMDGPAWSAFQAVRIVHAAALACGSTDGDALARQLASGATFDVGKGVRAGFDAAGHQLRQPLVLIKVNPHATASVVFHDLLARASFVAELPAPGADATGPVGRCT